MKKVLVIGASGQVGGALVDSLKRKDHDVIGTYFSNKEKGIEYYLDITNQKHVNAFINNSEFDAVILSSAYTNVDDCETKEGKEKSIKTNIVGVGNVSMVCRDSQIKLVYLSTDYIFDGKEGPYSEDAEANPISQYGFTKLEGERIVNSINFYHPNSSLIIRTTNIFDWNYGNNFFKWVYSSLEQGKQISGINDQYATPAYATDLADKITHLIEKDKSGVWNVGLDAWISRYEFALDIADFFGFDRNLIKGVSTEEFGKQLASRPKKGGFKLEKIKKEMGGNLMSIEGAFENIRRKIKNDQQTNE